MFDQKGILWFTVQQGNAVGRLDPRTGMIVLKKVPMDHALPYGIAVNSKGVEITEHQLPKSARPRRLAITADDEVYYSDYARGYLGHFDPASGKIEEWRSPGGADSEPYGITATPDGLVWYVETGLRPNRLVGFSPKTRAFAVSTPIPSGGGVVRAVRTGGLCPSGLATKST